VKPADDGYRTQSQDTSREIERMLVDRWRAMTPEEKLAEIDDTCRGDDQLALMGIRLRQPDALGRDRA
jgi:hypothetical protein